MTESKPMSDLKPCPFCGGEELLLDYHEGNYEYKTVKCFQGCNVPMGLFNWNLRPLEAAPQSQISLLERSCATLTKDRDEARLEAQAWRDNNDRSYRMSWENKTDE